MLNYRNVNILFILLILVLTFLDRHSRFSPSVYAWILLVYVSILFCGSYFIRLGYFFKSICASGNREKEIALSFDDGPAASFTPQVLDLLKEKKIEAIFFCIGKKIAGNESMLRRITEEGHIIGNHSYSHHPLFDLFGPEKMLEELQETNRTVHAITGLIPKFFRPPYGVTNPNLKKAVERGGFTSIGWNVRSLDTVIRDQDRLKQRVLRSVKPGSIVLFHDTSAATVKILGELIDRFQHQGYRIIRLDKMLKLNPYA